MSKQEMSKLLKTLSQSTSKEEKAHLIEVIYQEYLSDKIIPVLEDGKITWIPIKDINFVQELKFGLMLSHKQKVYFIRLRKKSLDISEIMSELPNFIRCNPRLFINLINIKEHDLYMQSVHFNGGAKLQVSQRIMKQLSKQLNKRKGE